MACFCRWAATDLLGCFFLFFLVSWFHRVSLFVFAFFGLSIVCCFGYFLGFHGVFIIRCLPLFSFVGWVWWVGLMFLKGF